MRLLSLLFGAATLAVAAASTEPDTDTTQTEEVTYFNAKKVPPVMELSPDNWEKEMKETKYIMVKHYSPYCHHCQAFAPTYETLYEFYYTSAPSGSGNENANFTKFYDFKFATINCVAFQDFCSSHGVSAYPFTAIFKHGEQIQSFRGVKKMDVLSAAIEDILEKEKPGTRPVKLRLPEPDDIYSADYLDSIGYDPAKAQQKKADRTEEKTEGTVKATAATNAATATAAKADPSADAKAKSKSSVVPHHDIPKPSKPSKSKVSPNIDGKSLPLSAETFQTQVTMTQDPWFIKFYAPWCHHCQAMAPNWEQLAKEMKGKLNIGEVNCEAESRLCKDVRLRGYPTILFFKGGERTEYDGLRGLGDFVHYAEKAIDIASGVQEVDAASFKALEEKEEVIFLYLFDHATTREDFMAIERLPLSLIGRAKLVKTQDPALFNRFKITTWPRLIVSREGRPTYYNPLTPREMRDARMLLDWMKSVWLPIVPELTASNAREIMDGKIVVLGILNRDDQDSFLGAKREMKSAANEYMDKQIHAFQLERQELRDAKQLRIEEAEDKGDQRALRVAKNIRINMDRADRKEVSFAWVDGVFWQRWVRTTYGIDVKDGERVIINDEDNRRYWDQTSTGNYIMPSRTSILETIGKVTASPPKIKPKLTVSSFEKIFLDIKSTLTEHPYLSLGCFLGIAFGCVSWFRGRLRRTRGHFKLDDSIKEYKAPLLGANANGKVD
ncbi:thioredoxin-like protein [Lasiosphaeria hispida]|uniref:Thioredoxin-like protein n=1 Tax=Lasiosphaeria hispida TaxID=260671 RepID=A0AAJ0MEM6_9PEZI|nr:thioredoxin-like protein [Lasiosphaeria hispida]